MDPSAAVAAARMNNEGVGELEMENYDAAIAIFSRGLALVKQVLATHGEESEYDDGEDDTNHSSGASEEEEGGPTLACQFRPCGNHDAKEAGDKTGASAYAARQHLRKEDAFVNGHGFVFRSPIFIPSHDMHVTSFKYYVKMSFVLLFNLALAHHLSAVSNLTVKGAVRKLKKALSLYELAYTIQMTEEINLTVLQTMAIVNNLGQIHSLIKSKEKSKQCFEHLLSTIMFLTDCGEQQEAEQNIDGFLENVMPLMLGASPFAPAA